MYLDDKELLEAMDVDDIIDYLQESGYSVIDDDEIVDRFDVDCIESNEDRIKLIRRILGVRDECGTDRVVKEFNYLMEIE